MGWKKEVKPRGQRNGTGDVEGSGATLDPNDSNSDEDDSDSSSSSDTDDSEMSNESNSSVSG